jgi:hypothetical protein
MDGKKKMRMEAECIEAVCIRVELGRGKGRGGRVPPFLHSEYKHVLLLSIHWMGRGREVHEERNVQDAMQYRRGVWLKKQ